MSKKIIELKNISFFYKDNLVLKNINLKIMEGEKVALIGKSGSGKSTLLSIINGTFKPDQGEVRINDKILGIQDNYKRENIGTIWQDLRLIDDLSAEQNVNCGLLGKEKFLFTFKNLLNLVSFNKAHKCMKLLELNSNIFSQNLNNISGGQKQRVAIARTLIQEPIILIADEPFNNLDKRLSNNIKDLFLSKIKSYQITIPSTTIVAMHNINLLKGFTRIIGIKNGEICLNVKKQKFKDYQINKIY